MARLNVILFLSGILLAGSACRKHQGTVLGKAPSGQPQTILAIRAGTTPPAVTLRGTMMEKCPTAGCWFHLNDRTGILKVDTKSAGFVVTKVPLQTEVTVSGNLVQEGEETILAATGLRY
jgi:hypothetical protein